MHQESGEQTERGEDSQTGGTQSTVREKGESAGSSIGQGSKQEVATPLPSSSTRGDRSSSPGVKEHAKMSPLPKEQARMSPLPKEQARVTFCTTPTSPTTNSSSKPPLQVPSATTLINLIHVEITQGAARTVPILRNSESNSSGGLPRMRNKSESSKLGDQQEDLKRLTAELEVVF